MFASKTRTIMPLALLAAVAMTCLQGAAFAGEVPMESNGRSIQVSTAGLNLANPADVSVLDSRIARAARNVCKPADSRDVRAIADRPACQKTAVANATAKRDVLVARAQAEQLAARVPAEQTAN